MAGLGVGGLAVALAAQQTLANLLGSIIIMIEKPFSLGHWIKLKNIEGKVENVGFRSTTIRTFYDSLVTIPNSQMISSTIDNMALRKYRQIETTLNLSPGTSTHKIESFIEGTKILLAGNPNTRKDKILVALDSLGSRSCPVIIISYYLKFDKRMEEIKERERILLDIMYLADSINVKFMT
jgi:MscS family membrane protein